MKKCKGKKVIALFLAMAMLFTATACANIDSGNISDNTKKNQENNKKGDRKQSNSSNDPTVQLGINGYVYIPEYIALDSERGFFNNISIRDGKLYYNTYIWDEETQTGGYVYFCKDVISGEETQLTMPALPEGSDVADMLLDKDGNMYLVLMDYSAGKTSTEGYMLPSCFLVKADEQGNEIYNIDITESLNKVREDIYIQNMAIDAAGHIYLVADQYIFLFDEKGAYQGNIQATDWISNIGQGKDGKIYITQWGSGTSLVLHELDYESKALGASYKNFPSSYASEGLCVGGDHDFIISDGSALFGYNMETQSSDKLLEWIDCDINGMYVEYIAVMEDGRIAAVIRDWSGDQTVTELALLSRTPVEQAVQKEIIVLGTLTADQSIETYAVKFNKTNDTYRIKIKSYIDRQAEWTETTLSDALTAMNNDLISGDGPDLIDLSSLNIETLVDKGMLEDLSSYLDQSEKFSKEDFVESVINGYTFDNVLTCIPMYFSVATVMGKASLVGDQMGWTLDDMIELMNENPEASPFEYATKEIILQYCLMLNQSAFINWKEVDCSFDTAEFKKVLEFANRFPTEYTYGEDNRSTPKKIADGDLLLEQMSLYDTSDISTYIQYFGGEPITYIGYPTVDGSIGSMMNGNGTFGIYSQSDRKEGCWEFIEYLLSGTQSSRNYYYMGFATRKEVLDSVLKAATQPQYLLDEKGNPVLDESGNPIEQGYGGIGFGDGTMIEGRALTEEEVMQIRQVLETAKPAFASDQQILSIILEEAGGYFKGQKTVDEVAGIIQGRVKIYISENS